MTPRQSLAAYLAGVAVVAALTVAAVAFFLQDDPGPPGSGEPIAYSCKEPRNPWYAICVMRSRGL